MVNRSPGETRAWPSIRTRNGAFPSCTQTSVSDPIGSDRELIDLVLARYAFAAMDLLDFGFEEIEEEPARHLTIA